ncbi:TPA: hypothetical protein RF355_003067 [Listeria monocytogenes]|nr:hypothetical protein [Listeria monocytogenes]HDU7262596.1 hypothetical protein [Listeria monocytogenes]
MSIIQGFLDICDRIAYFFGELVSIIVTSILLVIENVFTALYHAYQASGQMKWAWWMVMTILACMIVVFIIRYFIIVAVATLFLVPLMAFFVKAFLTIVVATFLLTIVFIIIYKGKTSISKWMRARRSQQEGA